MHIRANRFLLTADQGSEAVKNCPTVPKKDSIKSIAQEFVNGYLPCCSSNNDQEGKHVPTPAKLELNDSPT